MVKKKATPTFCVGPTNCDVRRNVRILIRTVAKIFIVYGILTRRYYLAAVKPARRSVRALLALYEMQNLRVRESENFLGRDCSSFSRMAEHQ